MEERELYTEEEKDKLVEKAILKVHYSRFKEIEMFVEKSIEAKLLEFCQRNPAINELVENRQSFSQKVRSYQDQTMHTVSRHQNPFSHSLFSQKDNPLFKTLF